MNPRPIRAELSRWASSVIPRLARTVDAKPAAPGRRALLVHVDGVSRRTLEKAVADGLMPFVGSLFESGAYERDSAFWGAPPSTPVFEASALYGVRHPDIPAYRWYDRAAGRTYQMNAPKDALEVEGRLRRSGESLLGPNGTAYLTLFQGGDANLLCMAALTDPKAALRELKLSVKALLASARRTLPVNFGHFAWEVLHAFADGARAGLPLFDWRHEQELALVRVFVLGALASMARARAMTDMVRGAPVVYLVEAGFDEVSHRRGPDSKQALRELRRIDAAIAHLHAIARTLHAPYDVYLFSDHGQVATLPYETLAGRTLEQALNLPAQHAAPLPAALTRALLDGRTAAPPTAGAAPFVVEVGAAAHVYLGRKSAPLEATELLASQSALLSRLIADPNVGLVALRRGGEAVGISNRQLFTAAAVPELPGTLSRRAVAEFLRELPKLPSAGDLVLFGQSTSKGSVGFSWEAGTHGGVTTEETDSFTAWPADAPVALDALGHAVELHRRIASAYRQ